MKYIRVASLVLLTLLILRLPDIAAGGSFLRGAKAGNPARLGIFSWQKNNASDEALREEMLGVLVSKGITEVYQTLDVKTAPSFIRRARELGIDVYMLAGRPEWGMDSGAKKMRGEVTRAARLMEETGKSGLAGLMLDVEPYLTSVYKKNRQNAMDRFSEAMRKTYAYAREMGVPLIICIPHFYDIIGFDEEMFNGNEAQTNELGRTKRSSAKAGLLGKETLGAFRVRDVVSGVEFSVGTGLTAAERQRYWDGRGHLIGSLVKYKFFPVGVKVAPRHPVFLGFRDRSDL